VVYDDLRGKVAIVTGAGRARGIGQAIAKRLAQDGARIVISDVGKAGLEDVPEYRLGSSQELEERAAEIRALGAEAVPVVADVTRADQVENLAEQAVRHFGQINILVNNAGMAVKLAPSLEWTEEEWDKVFAVNIKGTWLCCRAVARRMIEHQWPGKILNIASVAARGPSREQPAYAASKAAVLHYSWCLAQELAPHGINVNVVCPGIIDTQLWDMGFRMMYAQQQPGLTWEQIRAAVAKPLADADLKAVQDRFVKPQVPFGRMGTADEVADMVAFLVSDQARYITGQALNVSGGQAMD